MQYSTKTQQLIQDLYNNRDHVELTIGTLKNGKTETVHFNALKQEVPKQLIYPVGSIGKAFTASLLAKRVAEGKISLSDSIDQYIDGLPKRYYPNILRMATHHSGYGGAPFSTLESLIRFAGMNKPNGLLHVNPFRGTIDEKRMKEILCKKKLEDKEYKFEYSNLAYGTLGYILGKLSNTDYFTVMEEYIQELGLKDTSLKNSNFVGYDKKGNPCQPWKWERSDIIAPAGALLSSMEDLLQFAQIHYEGNNPYLMLCHKKYADGEKTFDQGLAWRLKKNSSISYHVGNAGSFSCILAMDLEKKTAVAIGLNYALVDIEELAFQILEEL